MFIIIVQAISDRLVISSLSQCNPSSWDMPLCRSFMDDSFGPAFERICRRCFFLQDLRRRSIPPTSRFHFPPLSRSFSTHSIRTGSSKTQTVLFHIMYSFMPKVPVNVLCLENMLVVFLRTFGRWRPPTMANPQSAACEGLASTFHFSALW
jgi:hypothetical protein